ncbi:hypothetical protein AALP_AA5G073100 [Arabis alpina]|uniref:Uncharacterized protein n=1 Tax=Arabis alpina TaxID=50452 RepID=A0A087GVI5_ARAAL|nr:hypothetical protein AALP_AA5G073100 [Arabis alpina]
MRGATPGILAFNVPSIPICSKKSRRLSDVSNKSEAEVTADSSTIVIIQDSKDNTVVTALPNQEENLAVQDGSQKIHSAIDAANTQKADDTLAQGSVPGESNEPKGPGNISRSKGKGKVNPADKKEEKKRIAARAKADFEAGRVPAFWIGRTCEVPPSDALVSQSLGDKPNVLLPVNSDSLVVPPSSVVQTTVVESQPPPPRSPSLTMLARSASEFLSRVFSFKVKAY